MHLTAKHLDDEAARIAKLRGGLLIVPACGSRFADFPPRNLHWLGALACLVSTVCSLAVIARFVAVLS